VTARRVKIYLYLYLSRDARALRTTTSMFWLAKSLGALGAFAGAHFVGFLAL